MGCIGREIFLEFFKNFLFLVFNDYPGRGVTLATSAYI